MTDEEALTLAMSAAEAWGGLSAKPRLIQNRENAVFEVWMRDGRHAALRLHRPGYQTRQAIEDELLITETLADTGFACPWPHRTDDGSFVHVGEDSDPLASLIQWIDGDPIGAMDQPFDGTEDEQAALYRNLGELIADLHLTADAVAPTETARPHWDQAAFCADQPLWGRFWENPTLSEEEKTLLIDARNLAADHLGDIPSEDSGFIHADLLQENVLKMGNQLYLIDFDDCGTGFRQLDLATALIQHERSPNFAELKHVLVEGYVSAGGPVRSISESSIALFMMLRGMASAGWICSRTRPGDPKQRFYAERAIRLARLFYSN